jgi:phage baseplate assembly protein gpV
MRPPELFLPAFILLLSAVPMAGTAAVESAGRQQATVQLADGAVLAVDAAARTFTLHGKRGDTTFAWDGATTVLGRKSPAYLKVGSSVTVQYTVSGSTKRAVKIAVHPARKGAEQG